MSQPSEHSSDGSSSQEAVEYHSEQESELEEEQVIIIDYSEGHIPNWKT